LFASKIPSFLDAIYVSLVGTDRSLNRARKINVSQASNHVPKGDEVFVQADGEHVGFLPATFSRIPGAIDLLV
jgi:diacylglycerol kinase family enzyme